MPLIRQRGRTLARSDHYLLIDGQNPVVAHFALDGAPIRRITLDLQDQPVTRADQLRYIQVDDTGHIWLEVPEWKRALDGRGTGRLYHVLSPGGEFLGTTRAPAPGRIMREHLLGIRVDPRTGREDYIVWRLVPQAKGFVYP